MTHPQTNVMHGRPAAMPCPSAIASYLYAYSHAPIQFRNPGSFEKIILIIIIINPTTPTMDNNCEVWLSLKIKTFVATEYRQYATFSNYWRNLTVTSTLLTNYCKHSINPRVRANAFVSFILPTHLCLSQDQAMNQVYTSHMHQHLLYAILISFYIFFLSALS